MHPLGRSTVFIGSSTLALPIANEVKRSLSDVADIDVWDAAFDVGTWLLGSILRQAQQSDFGIFVIRPDDRVRIGHRKQMAVRDNVLFEAGVFMGALGPERTILLWPAGKKASLRLPTDLEGLLRVTYQLPRAAGAGPGLKQALETIRSRIESMGPALRSGYNEIAALRQRLEETDIPLRKRRLGGLAEILQRAAIQRERQWFCATSVEELTRPIEEDNGHKVADLVFWWLVVHGIVTFNNVDQWTDDQGWDYKASLEYAIFTMRGVVLLNDMCSTGRSREQRVRGGAHQKRSRHRVRSSRREIQKHR